MYPQCHRLLNWRNRPSCAHTYRARWQETILDWGTVWLCNIKSSKILGSTCLCCVRSVAKCFHNRRPEVFLEAFWLPSIKKLSLFGFQVAAVRPTDAWRQCSTGNILLLSISTAISPSIRFFRSQPCHRNTSDTCIIGARLEALDSITPLPLAIC